MTDALAAVLVEPGTAPQLRDVRIPPPRATQVRVRIDAVGICHTDVTVAQISRGRRLPRILGHEGTGIVEAVGPDVTRVSPGQRVVLTFDSCGACARCVAGEPAYCAAAAQLNFAGDHLGVSYPDGTPVSTGFFGQSSFSRLAVANERNAIPIDHNIAPELAAPLGCSMQTGFGTVSNALRPGDGEPVVIFGAGAVGMSALLGVRHLSAAPIVVDPLPARRDTALALGAAAAIDPTGMDDRDIVEAVRDVTGGGARYCIDTTAIPAVLAQAVEALRPRGTLAVVGLGAPTAELPVGTIMAAGLRVQGVIEGDSQPTTFIPFLAGLVAAGRLPIDEIVEVFPFDRFDEAWAAAVGGSVVKPVVRMG